MEELKSLFGEGSLSYEEFSQKLGEAKDIKLANLKSGNYVDKAKYEKLETSVNEWQTKYSALEESTKGYGDLQTTYDTLKADYDALITKQDVHDNNVSANLNQGIYIVRLIQNDIPTTCKIAIK
jgi:predicted nuclease with TOPRIM domain